MKVLCVLINVIFLISLFAQQNDRTEIIEKRTPSSKTFQNSDGSYSIEMDAGYIHYKDETGKFEEINLNFVSSSIPEYAYEVTRGLYHVFLKSDLSQPQSIAFQTPGGAGLLAQPLAAAYLDISSKEYNILTNANTTTGIPANNEIVYENIFPGVHYKIIYLTNRLKEEISLTQDARNSLPNPAQFGFDFSSTFLVFITKLDIDLPTISPFANGVKIKNIIYEGEDQIDFKDLRGKVKFFFPIDIAFPESERENGLIENMIKIKKRIITQNGQQYLLAGIPLSWIQNAPSGTIIFDPQFQIKPPTPDSWYDTWIEYSQSSYYGGYEQIRIGNGFRRKRSLLKFNIDEINIPINSNIISASCQFYWYSKYGTPTNRTIKLHQLLVDWNESQVDWATRMDEVPWSVPGAGFNDIDARTTEEDAQLWDGANYPKWMIYNVTDMVTRWIEGTDPNYGMILWATNEATVADEKWACSSEYSNNDYHPKLIINYSLPQSITYYIRDAAGNVIATYKKNVE